MPDVAAENARFDLIDMLPAGAGGLRLVEARAWKGRGGMPVEFDQQTAIGRYDWVRRPGDRVEMVPTADELSLSAGAKITCRRTARDTIDCHEKGAMKFAVGAKPGCFFPERAGCKTADDGVMIEWPGCWVFFSCGSFNRGTVQDAAAIAIDVEAFASWFRTGRTGVPPASLPANRAVLVSAVAMANKRNR